MTQSPRAAPEALVPVADGPEALGIRQVPEAQIGVALHERARLGKEPVVADDDLEATSAVCDAMLSSVSARSSGLL
jgi:hypothetical protein